MQACPVSAQNRKCRLVGSHFRTYVKICPEVVDDEEIQGFTSFFSEALTIKWKKM